MVLGEHGDLRVVVVAHTRVLVDGQVHVHLRHARPHLRHRHKKNTTKIKKHAYVCRNINDSSSCGDSGGGGGGSGN